jgi:integrase/recombinase XerD
VVGIARPCSRPICSPCSGPGGRTAGNKASCGPADCCSPAKPISTQQLSRVVEAAGLTKHVSPHTLRHSFAAHLLEDGVDIRVIQVLLGHAKLDNTALYARAATKTVRTVTSPLDKIMARIAQGDSPGVSPGG